MTTADDILKAVFPSTSLNKKEDFNESAKKLIELKAGRHNDDIPLSDEYWVALQKHNLTYGMPTT